MEFMDDSSKANVTYRQFWPGFNKNENFISKALENTSFEGAIEVTSVFETPLQKLLSATIRRFGIPRTKASDGRGNTQPVRKVWFTGENKRPPHTNQFEAFISFDQDPMGGKNFYFPLFYVDLLISHPEATLRRGCAFPNPETLLEPRVYRSEKPKGVCAFISNGDPTRLRAIDELSKWIDVDVYGPWVNKSVLSKYQIAKDYKFTLCFENDLFPGYITEKLLDAYVCETVPLYWGDLGFERHINRSSFINAVEDESLSLFAERVGNMSREAYEAIYVQPIMKSLPSLQQFKRALTGL